MSDSDSIKAAVVAFLAECNVTFSAQFIAKGIKLDEWKCDEWRITLKGARGDYVMPYYCGIGHRVDTVYSRRARVAYKACKPTSTAWVENVINQMKPEAPTAADVMHSINSDATAIDQSFIDWCGDLGFETDSRKALQTYEACCESGRKLRVLFTSEQRAQLATIVQDY